MYVIQLLFTENTVRAHYEEKSVAVYCDNQRIHTHTHTHTQSFSLWAQFRDSDRCSRRQYKKLPLPLKPENSVTIFVPSGLALNMLFSTHMLRLYARHGSQLRMKSDYFPTRN
jgi:hypothetical protein